jgi:hypothetical protein
MTTNERTYTRYLIFETNEAGTVFTRVGSQLAGGAEEALRKFYADPPADGEGFNVAVSENSFKLRKAKARVTTSLEEIELPGLTAEDGPEPEEPEPVEQEALV